MATLPALVISLRRESETPGIAPWMRLEERVISTSSILTRASEAT